MKRKSLCWESFKILTLQGGVLLDPILRLWKCRGGKIVSTIKATPVGGAGKDKFLSHVNMTWEASPQPCK